MGTLTRSLANNITTGGVIAPAGITNATVADITSFPNASGGTLVLLSTQTASASANISFTTGLDSTYDEYIFKFIDIHPSVDGVDLNFQASTNGGSTYDVTATDTYFRAIHNEADNSTQLSYDGGEDIAQGTSFFPITMPVGSDNDQSAVAVLHLFNPSSTTFVKHFLSNSNVVTASDFSGNVYVGGYFNTTSAINAVQFSFDSGNIDDGIIKLYGVKKS